MKKLHAFAVAASLGAASTLAAQVQLVAGWDFGQFVFPGMSSTDPVNYSDAGYISANYSESANFSPVASHEEGVPVSSGTGAIYWDGSHSSSVFTASFDGQIQGAPGAGLTNAAMPGTNVVGAATFARNLSNGDSDPYSHALQVDIASTMNLAFVIDMTGFEDYAPASYGNVANFSFAASSNTGASIEWFFNGTSLGTSNITNGDLTGFSTYTVDLPANFYGAENTLVAQISGGRVIFDNVQSVGLAASPIPEPSSFAALAGLAGLGFAAGRRRRA
jgi:hypothetical protein